MASFKCKDIGMKCGFEVKDTTSKDERMKIVAVHAKETHNIAKVPADLSVKIDKIIKM